MREEEPNILGAISLARFGRPFTSIGDRERLFRDFRKYHKISARGAAPLISLPAIRNWFSPDRDVVPKRLEAMQFLYEYLVWLEENKYVQDMEIFAEIKSNLASFVSTSDRAARAPAGRAQMPKEWVGDHFTWEAALRVKGLYQVMRPSARKDAQRYALGKAAGSDDAEEYILEILAIDPSAPSHRRITMFSHKAPTLKRLYRGDMRQSTWAMFSMLERDHSNSAERKSFRAIATCINDLDHGECFSGMLTRSMSDDSGAGKRVMATPFVAMRSPYPPNAIYDENLNEDIRISLHELRGSLLVGHLNVHDRHHKELIQVCDGIFRSLNPTFHFFPGTNAFAGASKAIITTSSDNRFVRDEIERRLGGEQSSYFEQWQKIVRGALSER